MGKHTTYRSRFRFRLEKTFNLDINEHRFNLDGYEVVLSAPDPEEKIKDSKWLIMNTYGFCNEVEAKEFSEKLKASCELSSVSARIGIDSGTEKITSAFFMPFVEKYKKETGHTLIPNRHGIDVFIDDPNIRIANITAAGTVSTDVNPFISDLPMIFSEIEDISSETKDIILLMNYALMRPDPVARIVFSISAVEMLGQNENWTDAQKELLNKLSGIAQKSKIGTSKERMEVVNVVKKGLHRLSLRQGVLRLLDALDLNHLAKNWDELYNDRSKLVHGMAPKPGIDYNKLSNKVVSLCGQILLTRIAKEVPSIEKNIGVKYY